MSTPPPQPSLHFLSHPPPALPPQLWEHTPGKYLAWNEYGTPTGHPVLYYHGWPSSRLQARLAHHLAIEKNIRLISMDRPGIGKSTLIPNRHIDDWPTLISRFADHLHLQKFGQLGISGGGPYVLSCAASIPERLTASAVLAGMVPIPLTTLGTRGLHPLYRTLIPLRKSPSLLFTALFRIASAATRTSPKKLPISLMVRTLATQDRILLHRSDAIWEVATTSFTEGVSSGGKGVITDAEIYFQTPHFSPSEITHPIHYWHGGDDKNIPLSLVENLTSSMPHAHLETAPTLGHFSLAIYRAPHALDYLATHATTSPS